MARLRRITSPTGVERRTRARAGPLLRWYYRLKYKMFERERRPHDGRRGLLVLQLDALAYADLRRASDLGYTPTINRLIRDEGYRVHRWFCEIGRAHV